MNEYIDANEGSNFSSPRPLYRTMSETKRGGAVAKYAELKAEAAALGEKVMAQMVQTHTLQLEEHYYFSRGKSMVDFTPAAATATATGHITARKLDYTRPGLGSTAGEPIYTPTLQFFNDLQ